MSEASDVPAGAGTPEPGAEEDKPPAVRYWQRECGDTEGRGIVELTPFGGTAKRYKVDVTFQKGQKAQRVVFEIEADSADEAFDRYDARLEEEKKKFEAKASQTSLIVGPNPKIDEFRRQKRGRQGGNGGMRRIRLP
ncbi:MAG TPA: hypothetical protein VMY35_14425 [Phycisphaerae bacterium]|nr:hypothetical protein [Phycisphaerae bacterium]